MRLIQPIDAAPPRFVRQPARVDLQRNRRIFVSKLAAALIVCAMTSFIIDNASSSVATTPSPMLASASAAVSHATRLLPSVKQLGMLSSTGRYRLTEGAQQRHSQAKNEAYVDG